MIDPERLQPGDWRRLLLFTFGYLAICVIAVKFIYG